jgi:hypothetical protein
MRKWRKVYLIIPFRAYNEEIIIRLRFLLRCIDLYTLLSLVSFFFYLLCSVLYYYFISKILRMK